MTRAYFIKNIAPILPSTPGIYRYYNRNKRIIYVGKARNIKKRVTSYFLNKNQNGKTIKLLQAINHIEYTVTNNEHDAFLLENSLIKHFKPLYNIALKDDKSYPYVVIKNEPFPRLFLTRRLIKDGSEYIGPFTSVWRVRELLNLIRDNIPLRTCSLPLTKRNIEKGKFKVCLEYHLGNCGGPCQGFQSEEDYMKNIDAARSLLKGNLSEINKILKKDLKDAIEKLQFERAHNIQNKIDAFSKYQNQSGVVNIKVGDADVATIIDTEHTAYVNYMTVREGSVLQSKNLIVEKKMDETANDILSFCIAHNRHLLNSDAQEIIVPIKVNLEDEQLSYTIPISGDKKKLLNLSFKNAEYHKLEAEKKSRLKLRNYSESDLRAILIEMQEALQLPEYPAHIECFDNSNFQGSYPVAAMVCFKDGLPYKNDYRHFHIKTVEGINDFASMHEIVYRRYKRLAEEKKALPDLIIIDGGKGQLSAAHDALEELGITGKVTLISLAEREEQIFFYGDKEPVVLPLNSSVLLLIRRIRDEVHRFGITFHRATRSKGTIKNELESIKGIGKKTAETLLRTYRSVAKIKKLSEEQLALTIDKSKAKLVYTHFHKTED